MKREPVRGWDWLAAALTMGLMLTSVGRLGITEWVPDLNVVQRLAVLGCALGLALGVSRFGRREVTLLALGYTLTFLPWQISTILSKEVPFLGERLSSVAGRLWFALSEFASGRPIEDPLFFVILLGLVYWIIGLCAGYGLTRHASLLAVVLPAGVVLMIVHAYDSAILSRVWFAGFYVFLSLLLMSRLNFLREQADRQKRRVFVTPESGADLSSGALVAALALVLLAWTLPATLSGLQQASDAWEQASGPWQRLRDRLSDAFAAVNGGAGSELYGDQLPLGTGSRLREEAVFQVTIQSATRDLPRYYWRGRVYDTYEDGQWSNRAALRQVFDPEEGNLQIPEGENGRVAFFVIENQQKQYTYYLPAQPVWVSRPGQSLFFRTPDGQIDLVWLRATTRLERGDTFQARALVRNPTVRELRSAGRDYPAWVTERYLQLPADFPPRLRQLAIEITNGQETPYDQAAAITAYLRANIEYQPVLPPPPSNADPIEWFLFEQKQGFCNYYATAEVLLLRSLGIPARLAVGYAEGKSDEFERRFTVRQLDAHAWPEVYFPNIGWVEFEPTVNQAPLERPAGTAVNPAGGGPMPVMAEADEEEEGGQAGPAINRSDQENTPVEIVESTTGQQTMLTGLLWLAAAAFLLSVLFLMERRFGWISRAPILLRAGLERRNLSAPGWLVQWEQLTLADPIARAFETINLGLRLLGERPPGHATPAQRAAVLSELLPEAADEIAALAAEHQAQAFSPRPGNVARARRAALVLWRRLLPAALRHLGAQVSRRFFRE